MRHREPYIRIAEIGETRDVGRIAPRHHDHKGIRDVGHSGTDEQPGLDLPVHRPEAR